jgi:hypothetical protein
MCFDVGILPDTEHTTTLIIDNGSDQLTLATGHLLIIADFEELNGNILIDPISEYSDCDPPATVSQTHTTWSILPFELIHHDAAPMISLTCSNRVRAEIQRQSSRL